MKVDYLSEFGFRLSDYGKYSTIVLFLPPAPRPPLGGAPGRCGRRCRWPRGGRSGAERCPARPRLRGSAGLGRGAGAALPAASRGAGPPPPHRNFCRRVRGAGLRAERGCGRSGARRPRQVRGAAAGGSPPLSLCFFHLFYGSCSRARRRSGPALPAPPSRGLRSLRRSSPAALSPRAERRAGRERMRRGSLWGF